MQKPKHNVLPRLDQDRTDAIAPAIEANRAAIDESHAVAAEDDRRAVEKSNSKLIAYGSALLAATVIWAGVNAVKGNRAHSASSPTPDAPLVHKV